MYILTSPVLTKKRKKEAQIFQSLCAYLSFGIAIFLLLCRFIMFITINIFNLLFCLKLSPVSPCHV